MGQREKWTPGPWEAEASIPQDGFECFWIRNAREFGPMTAGSRVTEIGSVNGPQWKEQEANAHLIAAAPELYEALQESMRLIGEMAEYGAIVTDPIQNGYFVPSTWFEHQAKALAKARGEAS